MLLNRKITAAVLCLLTALSLTGCAGDMPSEDANKMRIICTGFSEYDWTCQIMGTHAEEAEITYLLENGSDLHSYQPSAIDMAKIAECDLLVYVGGESGQWVTDALTGAVNPDMLTVDLLGTLGTAAKAEELKEGMQAECEEEEALDEHVWLSLRNAKRLCREITDKLCIIDSANADDYRANLAAYTEQLEALDAEIQSVADSASVRTIVFGDRFPFRYFTDDYGLDYYAAFAGCSAETEASFETVIFLAEKLDELGSSTIYTIESSDQSMADTIISNTRTKDQQIAVLNSIQSVTGQQIADGVTYLSLMQDNCTVLQATLQ